MNAVIRWLPLLVAGAAVAGVWLGVTLVTALSTWRARPIPRRAT